MQPTSVHPVQAGKWKFRSASSRQSSTVEVTLSKSNTSSQSPAVYRERQSVRAFVTTASIESAEHEPVQNSAKYRSSTFAGCATRGSASVGRGMLLRWGTPAHVDEATTAAAGTVGTVGCSATRLLCAVLSSGRNRCTGFVWRPLFRLEPLGAESHESVRASVIWGGEGRVFRRTGFCFREWRFPFWKSFLRIRTTKTTKTTK
jgi:hypothetical protein